MSLFLTVALMTPVAEAAPGVDRSLLEKVWAASRLDGLSESMASNMLLGLEQSVELQQQNPQRRERLLAHYRQHTRAENFARGLRRTLGRANDAQLQALLNLASAPVARKALRHELAFVPVTPEVLDRHAGLMQQTEDGRARLQAITSLDDAIGVTDMAVAIASSTAYGAATTMQEVEGSMSHGPADSAYKSLQAYAERIRPWQARQVQKTYLYLYRHMALSDLQAYVALQENPAVKSMQRQFIRSLGEEMITIQREVMREVIRDLRGKGQRQA